MQERALKAIPSLYEDLPYDVLEQVLLVKVAVSHIPRRHCDIADWQGIDSFHENQATKRESVHARVFLVHGPCTHTSTPAAGMP